MTEMASKLEGLQAIIQPLPPVENDTAWVVAGLILFGFLLSAIVTYVLMQRHGSYQARRHFAQLRSHINNMQPAEIGASMMSVLRIALNHHNLLRSHKPEAVKTISQHEWSTLLDHCDSLRYATNPHARQVIPEAVELLHKLLRGHV